MDLYLRVHKLITVTYNKVSQAFSSLLVFRYKLTHTNMEIPSQRFTGSLWVPFSQELSKMLIATFNREAISVKLQVSAPKGWI